MLEPLWTREFSLTYISEMSAKFLLTVYERQVELEMNHAKKNVPASDWFHFTDHESNSESIAVRAGDIHSAIVKMADILLPGVDGVFSRRDNIGSAREKLLTDMYLAFVSGHWYPSGDHDYRHPVGGALDNRKI